MMFRERTNAYWGHYTEQFHTLCEENTEAFSVEANITYIDHCSVEG